MTGFAVVLTAEQVVGVVVNDVDGCRGVYPGIRLDQLVSLVVHQSIPLVAPICDFYWLILKFLIRFFVQKRMKTGKK